MHSASASRSGSWSIRPLAALLACSVASGAASAGDGVKLSGPLAQPIGGDVGTAYATPDGGRVVYVADGEVDDFFELYVVPSEGGAAPIRISAPSHGSVHWVRGRFLPDGQTLLYFTTTPATGLALQRVPVDGSAAPIELVSGITYDDLLHFRYDVSPDGQWVLFREESPQDLWAVRTDGGSPPISLAPTGAVEIGTDFAASPDWTRVAFRARGASTPFELYGAPIDGGAPAVRLNGALGPDERVAQLAITADGASVVHVVHGALVVPDGYGGFDEFPRDYRLARAPIDGSSAAVALGAAFAEEVSVGLVKCVPGRVVYVADARVDERDELFSLALDGSSPPVRLNGDHASMQAEGVRYGAKITADDRHVVYRTWGLELYVAPVDEAGKAKPLSRSGIYVDDFVIAEAAGRVLYEGLPQGGDDTHLYSAALPGDDRRGSLDRAVVRLADDIYGFQLHPDGHTVLCTPGSLSNLVRVDVLGREAPVALASVWSYAGIGGGRLLFWEYELYGQSDLFSLPLAGGEPVRLNSDLAPGPVVGRIQRFATSPDGSWAAYIAEGVVPQRYELYGVPTDGSRPPLQISDDFGNAGGPYPDEDDVLRFTPDGTRVVYLSSQDLGGTLDLFVVPVDGSAPPTRLTVSTTYDGVQPGFEITPDGARAVFLVSLPNGAFSTSHRLATVRLDGSAPYALLSGTPVLNGHVFDFEISPDSSRVVYKSSEQFAQYYDLLSVSIDGGPIAMLKDIDSLTRRVYEYSVSADGTRVLYTFQGSGNKQLFSVPIDGSSPPVLVPSSDSVDQFALTPDGTGVIYSSGAGDVLFRAPLDASSALQLNPTPAPGWRGGNNGFQLSPDGSRVVFVSDQESDGVMGVFSVPTDGSQVLTRLSGPPFLWANYWHRLFVDATSTRVVYLSDVNDPGTYELCSAPISGDAPHVVLSRPIVDGGGFDLDFFEEPPIAVQGRRVAFAVDGEVAGRTQLYLSLDSRSPAIEINAPIEGDSASSLPFLFAGPNRIVYLAAEEQAGVPELFARSFAGPHFQHGAR